MPAGIDVSQTGHAILTLPKFNETYLITLPTLNIRGIVTGRPSVELSGSTYIVSSANQLSSIEYSTKGYFSGERHSFKATIKSLSPGSSPIYSAQGVWSGVSHYKDHQPSSPSSSSSKKCLLDGRLFFDALSDVAIAPHVTPAKDLGPLESHRLWATVTKAINAKDYGTASREKSQIEDAQRVLAKARKERGETQADALKLFALVDEDADESGKAFKSLKEKLINVAGAKAIKEDDKKPHWRLRQ